MKAALLLRVLSATSLLVNANAKSIDHQQPREDSLDDFIKDQQQISLQGMLNNIVDGVVVAGRSDPDYWFTWTRTAALTFKILIERLTRYDLEHYPNVSDDVTDYLKSQAKLQSGDLGEPKFYVNGTAFDGPWNRPQQDGPALRATALTLYARYLIGHAGDSVMAIDVHDHVVDKIWPIISKDLEHIIRCWNQTSFDIWEETNGSSFFTLSASHRALVEGMSLAKEIYLRCDGCAVTAPQILCFMNSFWDVDFMHANLNSKDQRRGIDASSILSSIHTYDPKAGCTDSSFQPCSPRALANHKAVIDSFRQLYAINHGIPQGQAVAVGRYPEDVSHGGNPWYTTTLAAAEQLYLARLQWQDRKEFTIDETSLPFFRDLLPTILPGTYRQSSDPAFFDLVLSAVQKYADGYMALIQRYTPTDGGLSEQFDRNNGVPVSASNFTWSHAAFYTAANRRIGIKGFPWSSWGEPSNNAFKLWQCHSHARVTFHVGS
ncbi:uncharacterized protein J4E87_010346 [Alternaria ethzedia]|uniref:uncharacterized protein n=1 Tax=Alternaria ethzedia TaxID=181014 RepID=UPI0020C3F8C1|nr:uncharacterized protein J4E87_010346 [Alternaria ethzedia]KAI4611844.1 hypothetical protein J4E87_010346 [Alternaria ethzedia]